MRTILNLINIWKYHSEGFQTAIHPTKYEDCSHFAPPVELLHLFQTVVIDLLSEQVKIVRALEELM